MKKLILLLAVLTACASSSLDTPAVVPSFRTVHVENMTDEAVTIYTERPNHRLGVVIGSEDNFALPDDVFVTGELILSIGRVGQNKVVLAPVEVGGSNWKFELVVQREVGTSYVNMLR